MRKTAGFTLIELVIVIVIIGILGAIAAPRFINLQGDAYEANVKSLAGSIKSATTLANTKAIINGYDGIESITVDKDTFENESVTINGIEFAYGFPAATENGILEMLQDDSFADDTTKTYKFKKNTEDPASIIISPSARDTVAKDEEEEQCHVVYTAAENKNTPAKVEAFTKGC